MHKGIDGGLTLVVLDGVGEVDRLEGNAVAQAHTPFLNALRQNCRFRSIKAHGPYVGLPSKDDMGNSEVGHNALGAGQIYDQGAKLVNMALESGTLFEGKVWQDLVSHVRRHQGTLHFLGLLSDGKVHSHIDHLLQLLARAAWEKVNRVRIHILLDGRDVGTTTALSYVDQLEDVLARLNEAGNDYRIASGGGRMVMTMDRYEADWSMVEKGWRHHVMAEGRRFPSAHKAIETYRAEIPGVGDQDLPPFIVADGDRPVGPIDDGDGVVLFNFRGDRAIEISTAFEADDSFAKFSRGKVPEVYFAGMMQYDGDLMLPTKYLVGPPNIKNTMTEFLVDEKIKMFALSETQKYGHITYFWNGNRSGKISPRLEDYLEIPSEVSPFNERPWMKAAEITDALEKAILSGSYQFHRVNYANGDMVGHTGDFDAALAAMSCLDLQLRRLFRAVEKTGGVAIVTADHGNADEMYILDNKGKPVLDGDGRFKPKTSHSLNPVPFILFDPKGQVRATLKQDAEMGLANVASAVAELLGFPVPNMWQPSLLNWSL